MLMILMELSTFIYPPEVGENLWFRTICFSASACSVKKIKKHELLNGVVCLLPGSIPPVQELQYMLFWHKTTWSQETKTNMLIA